MNPGYLEHYPHVTLLDIISKPGRSNLAISKFSKGNTILRELDDLKIRHDRRMGQMLPQMLTASQ